MPDETNRITEGLEAPDANTRRFHLGSAPQVGIPPDLTDEETAALELHTSTIHAPSIDPPAPTDAEGNPVVVPTQGLVITDPETGAVEPLPAEGEPAPARSTRTTGTDPKPADKPVQAPAPRAAGSKD